MVTRLDDDGSDDNRELIKQLESYSVAPTGLNRDEVLFRAGFAAALRQSAQRQAGLERSRQRWRMVCTASVVVSLSAVVFAVWPAWDQANVVRQPTRSTQPTTDAEQLAEPTGSSDSSQSAPTHPPAIHSPPVHSTAGAELTTDAHESQLGLTNSTTRIPTTVMNRRGSEYSRLCDRLATDGIDALPESTPLHLAEDVSYRAEVWPDLHRLMQIDKPTNQVPTRFPGVQFGRENSL